MWALRHHYGVELQHFSPNAITAAAVFAVVCEGYLGMMPHWDLWLHLYRGELFNASGGTAGVRKPGSIDVRSSKPPVKEDEVDRDKRRESAEKQKSATDLKKEEKKKNVERQALETRRAKSRQRGEPEEESPDEDDGGDGDDDNDDSEGMASRLDRILEGPPQTGVDVPRMGVPKGAPSGSRESQQREPSPRRSHADTPPEPAPGRTVPRPQPPPAFKAGHRVKALTTGLLTRGRAAASSSSDPRPSAGAESAPPRPLLEESTPPSPKRVKAPHPQEHEGAPEPPRSGVEEDPITISDGSSGDRPSRDARPMDEERKRGEEEREREAQHQPQQEREEGEERRRPEGAQVEELLEQDRQEELRELQEE
ncbi:cyclic nucleotide-gated cation channel beta-1-like [Sorghum bicolor]|uniref:cyclic nucleotide-gated cation channel beta-1-like n=1 Tax=Sorghum bicolor TaxID=4558 RepID=UPI000B426C46|nr:cyclic nucleotide-gated cation channel beta-1-like [Sorghum bicolor]|eukprot:XP_021303788.1 cyclic nucleotide-gated cation channel beta-1-like [Sorghum bicolor]